RAELQHLGASTRWSAALPPPLRTCPCSRLVQEDGEFCACAEQQQQQRGDAAATRDAEWSALNGGDVCVSGHDSGPVFEEQPTGLVYPEGLTEGKVTLSCQARASPAATYRWRVNGTEVQVGMDPHYTLVAGNLVINGPQPDRHAGSYQCLAINRCGAIASRAANLKFGYLHDFPPDARSPQMAYEGVGTFLACQPPTHYPALSYRWFLNEFPNFIKPDDGSWFVTGNLYLAKAEPNDTGNYFCFTTINMEISTKSTFSKANQLTVLPDGVPVPKLRWRKVDGLLPAKAGKTAESSTLTLPDLSFDDEGLYECEALMKLKLQVVWAAWFTVVLDGVAQPEWLQVMSDSEVEISSELQWSCMAAGKPRPSIRWLRNGQPLSTQPTGLVYPEGLTEGKVTLSCQARASPAATYRWRVNGTEVQVGMDPHYTLVAGNLVINGPQPDRHAGSYQCLAINRCGAIASRAANLKFGYLHDFPPDARSPQMAYEGVGTFLACQPPTHYPALSYRWFLNEFPNFIKPDDGSWFVTGNLYLAKAEPNDTGNYFCFTTINMEISTKSTFSKANQLTVLPDANHRKSAPTIKVRFPAETYALSGRTTQLECFAYGNPVPKLRWRKVDGLLPAKAGKTAESSTLTLPDLSFDDEGLYECEASA
ncbi:LOW QUALITY PROTEIN: hypothetical protein CRUP_009579, partial [Coryphaenoides rupestris]